MKDVVTLKVKRDRLKIYLDPETDFFQIKQNLLDKITEIKGFVGKVKQLLNLQKELSQMKKKMNS